MTQLFNYISSGSDTVLETSPKNFNDFVFDPQESSDQIVSIF